MRTDMEILSAPFDMETHKSHFINYFEAIITEDGIVHYAIPSHHVKLKELYMKTIGLTEEQVEIIFKGEMLLEDVNMKMMKSIGAVMVWYDIIKMPPKISNNQLETLRKLEHNKIIASGLIPGNIEPYDFKGKMKGLLEIKHYGDLGYSSEYKPGVRKEEKFIFNINDMVTVELTDVGVDILRKQHYQDSDLVFKITGESIGEFEPPVNNIYTKQMWQLMNIFGTYLMMGGPLPFATTVEVTKKNYKG